MKHSDRCFIPTNDLLRWVTERYKINKSLIHLIPNFVDTDLFKPDIQKKCEFDIICIGRLSPEKRHKLILEAVEKLSFKKVLFIGSGPLKNDLIITGSKLNVNIQVIDKVSNSELPAYINSSKYFILASTWEGHPKSLIEAMSCGCICIGADRPGINNMVRHNETGILFNSTSAGLREAIINISNNLELSNKIQQNARNFILENMSFKKISSDYKTVLYHL
jgi:glycosyltransferase involved in cell wall biosynthesis